MPSDKAIYTRLSRVRGRIGRDSELHADIDRRVHTLIGDLERSHGREQAAAIVNRYTHEIGETYAQDS